MARSLPPRRNAKVSAEGMKSASEPWLRTAEFGELAVEGLVAGEEDVEQLRPHLRHQTEHDRHALRECRLVIPQEAGIVGSALAQVGRFDFDDVRVVARLAEVQLEAGVEHAGEPVEFEVEVVGVVANFLVDHHSTPRGTSIQGSLTQSKLQGKRSSTTS